MGAEVPSPTPILRPPGCIKFLIYLCWVSAEVLAAFLVGIHGFSVRAHAEVCYAPPTMRNVQVFCFEPTMTSAHAFANSPQVPHRALSSLHPVHIR